MDNAFEEGTPLQYMAYNLDGWCLGMSSTWWWPRNRLKHVAGRIRRLLVLSSYVDGIVRMMYIHLAKYMVG
jgi:hypothetical protein